MIQTTLTDSDVDVFLLKILSRIKLVAEAEWERDRSTDVGEADFLSPIFDLLRVPVDNVADDEDGIQVSEYENYSREFLAQRFWSCDGSAVAIRRFILECRQEAVMGARERKAMRPK